MCEEEVRNLFCGNLPLITTARCGELSSCLLIAVAGAVIAPFISDRLLDYNHSSTISNIMSFASAFLSTSISMSKR
jgi:hypothetical protein